MILEKLKNARISDQKNFIDRNSRVPLTLFRSKKYHSADISDINYHRSSIQDERNERSMS